MDVGEGRQMRDAQWPTRVVVAGVFVAALVALALVLLARGGGYAITAEFVNGGQLVEGSPVRVSGATVGSVQEIRISENGQALVRFSVDDEYAPLRRGTRALIRPTSLSGIANRYVDLHLGPANGEEIEDGGRLGTDDTGSAVEIDQLLAIFDTKTRQSLRDTLSGSADQLRGRADEINDGVEYLNPALSTGARLFRELSRDEPLLERYLVDSARFVNALAERRADLGALVTNANQTFRALGSQQTALAEAVELLPPFMRRANTTFVNLRSALDDVDPLVEVSIPAARRLGPFLDRGAGLRGGRGAHVPRSLADDPAARRRKRPDRAAGDLPPARARGPRLAPDQRRCPARCVPRVRRRPDRVERDLQASASLHPGPRRLV